LLSYFFAQRFTVQVPAETPAGVTGKFKRLVLAVKAASTEVAIAMLTPYLADDGYVLPAQNDFKKIAMAPDGSPGLGARFQVTRCTDVFGIAMSAK
jgi:ketopantoate reductase